MIFINIKKREAFYVNKSMIVFTQSGSATIYVIILIIYAESSVKGCSIMIINEIKITATAHYCESLLDENNNLVRK